MRVSVLQEKGEHVDSLIFGRSDAAVFPSDPQSHKLKTSHEAALK